MSQTKFDVNTSDALDRVLGQIATDSPGDVVSNARDYVARLLTCTLRCAMGEQERRDAVAELVSLHVYGPVGYASGVGRNHQVTAHASQPALA